MSSEYFSQLCAAMELLAEHPRSVFMGQAVACAGTGMTRSLEGVPMEKRVEFPVAEDMQMGMAIGASLRGELPICIYPRWNFLLLAMSQLVLHLDRLPLFSGYRPRVIIRTAVATDKPLHPGPQHIGDFSGAVRSMLRTTTLIRLFHFEDIVPLYREAMKRTGPTIMVEFSELY